MEHLKVYELSKRYGPPKVDLRQAEIADSYGDESHTEIPVDHKVPEDVTREQFDYYGMIYPFIEETDFLFYLYPIAREYQADKRLNCIDSFLFSLDRHIGSLMSSLPEEEKESLKEGLLWIWEVGEDEYADWEQCPNLQEAIGLK